MLSLPVGGRLIARTEKQPMSQKQAVAAFWETYLSQLPEAHPHHHAAYKVWSFGDSPALADELLQLVLDGVKTATAASLWEYEAENEPIPEVGGVSIVLDGRGMPACILETVEVFVRPFDAIPAEFAYDEGEYERTLESWRREHQKYWTRALAAIGHAFSPDMPVVAERFRLIFPR
jgi:uncharacterized protein YhfF